MIRLLSKLFCAAILWCTIAAPGAQAEDGREASAIAMHGAPRHGEAFRHFTYVNPEAPKGGTLRVPVIGGFDSLNPYIVLGRPARGLGLVFESLMKRSADEPFTLYPGLARAIKAPPDRSWVEFELDPAARFHDGTPVTADDVLFSHRLLARHGRPHMRTYYGKVTQAEKLAPLRVRFSFGDSGDYELPLILGLMPILPSHAVDEAGFAKASLDVPVGSGPYFIESVDPGRRIVYGRDRDYWGWGLAAMTGRHNFERIEFLYFRDASIAFEAFLAGELDVWAENDPARWATGYDHRAVETGAIRRLEIRHDKPVGMKAVVFNTRRPALSHRRVRRALSLAFDFAWINRTFFHGAYARTESYFENSELAASGPAAAEERALLAPWREDLPTSVFEAPPPPADAGNRSALRRNMRKAAALLEGGGWIIRDGRRIDGKTGRPLRLEFLSNDADIVRLLLHYARNLERLGIEASVRTVDSAHYQKRLETFDFDAIVYHWGQSLSPGNEQAIYWGSAAAGQPGSRNYAGIRNPAVDAMVDELVKARTRDELVTAARALDRILRWSRYVLPLYHDNFDRLAVSSPVTIPKNPPLYGTTLDLWWETGANKRP